MAQLKFKSTADDLGTNESKRKSARTSKTHRQRDMSDYTWRARRKDAPNRHRASSTRRCAI